MKRLEELQVIEQRIDYGTLERNFFRANGGSRVPKENITVLAHSPVLLTRIYNEFRFLENGKIPEEADAILVGQCMLAMGGTPREIYPASYCKIKSSDETPKRYDLVECNHRICDCHMGESPKGKFVEYKE